MRAQVQKRWEGRVFLASRAPPLPPLLGNPVCGPSTAFWGFSTATEGARENWSCGGSEHRQVLIKGKSVVSRNARSAEGSDREEYLSLWPCISELTRDREAGLPPHAAQGPSDVHPSPLM